MKFGTYTHQSFYNYSVVEAVDGGVLSPISRSVSRSVSPASSIMHQPVPKKRRCSNKADAAMDEVIIRSLKGIEDRQAKRDHRPETVDGEGHYGSHVAATLRKLTPKQQAIARLQIDQVLLNVEFPCDPSYPPPPTDFFH